MRMMLDENGNIITPGMIRAQQRQAIEEEEAATAAEGSYRESALKHNMTHMNKKPVKCVICGSSNFEDQKDGSYVCGVCGETSYDSYGAIRRYIDAHGLYSVDEVADGAGVHKDVVKFYIQEYDLEITPRTKPAVPCEGCGRLIAAGFLCDQCKRDRMRAAILAQGGIVPKP